TGLTLCQLGHRGRIGSCRQSANGYSDERHIDLPRQTLVAIVIPPSSRAADCEVLLRGLEDIEESVLEDIYFVVVVLTPQACSVRADVSHLDGGISVQLSLEPKRVRLRVAGLEIWIKVVDARRSSG